MLPDLKISVLNPADDTPVPAAEWMRRDDKESAEWLLIEVALPQFKFKLHKKEQGTLSWFEAVSKCEAAGGRAGTRAELLALYDARFGHGLNEILDAIGGDPIRGWYWTQEEDADPQSNATRAWGVGLYYGGVNDNAKTNGYQVRLISAF
jgi:hypothetical protein